MLKKFIGRSTADHVRKIKDSLGECHFAAKEVIVNIAKCVSNNIAS